MCVCVCQCFEDTCDRVPARHFVCGVSGLIPSEMDFSCSPSETSSFLDAMSFPLALMSTARGADALSAGQLGLQLMWPPFPAGLADVWSTQRCPGLRGCAMLASFLLVAAGGICPALACKCGRWGYSHFRVGSRFGVLGPSSFLSSHEFLPCFLGHSHLFCPVLANPEEAQEGKYRAVLAGASSQSSAPPVRACMCAHLCHVCAGLEPPPGAVLGLWALQEYAGQAGWCEAGSLCVQRVLPHWQCRCGGQQAGVRHLRLALEG